MLSPSGFGVLDINLMRSYPIGHKMIHMIALELHYS